MKNQKTVEEYFSCDNCKKEIKTSPWYRLFLDERHDFCMVSCAEEYRNSRYRVITYDEYPRVIGNTD